MAKTVLVVDDDPDVRLFSVTVLEEHGYTPLEAANGEEGLKMIKEQKPDLIILDVLMPRQSGIRLYRELKTDKSLKSSSDTCWPHTWTGVRRPLRKTSSSGIGPSNCFTKPAICSSERRHRQCQRLDFGPWISAYGWLSALRYQDCWRLTSEWEPKVRLS